MICGSIKASLNPGMLPVNIVEECFDENFEGDYWSILHACFNGPEGRMLMAEMARRTAALSPPLTRAPVVTLNGVQSTNAVTTNFFQAVCSSYGVSAAARSD